MPHCPNDHLVKPFTGALRVIPSKPQTSTLQRVPVCLPRMQREQLDRYNCLSFILDVHMRRLQNQIESFKPKQYNHDTKWQCTPFVRFVLERRTATPWTPSRTHSRHRSRRARPAAESGSDLSIKDKPLLCVTASTPSFIVALATAFVSPDLHQPAHPRRHPEQQELHQDLVIQDG